MVEPVERDDFVNLPDRAFEAAFKNFAGELRRLLALRGRDTVNFIQHDQNFVNVGGDRLDQRHLLPGNRRVGAHHQDGSIDLRYEEPGGFRISGEDRPNSRRVDQAHSTGQQR